MIVDLSMFRALSNILPHVPGSLDSVALVRFSAPLERDESVSIQGRSCPSIASAQKSESRDVPQGVYDHPRHRDEHQDYLEDVPDRDTHRTLPCWATATSYELNASRSTNVLTGQYRLQESFSVIPVGGDSDWLLGMPTNEVQKRESRNRATAFVWA